VWFKALKWVLHITYRLFNRCAVLTNTHLPPDLQALQRCCCIAGTPKQSLCLQDGGTCSCCYFFRHQVNLPPVLSSRSSLHSSHAVFNMLCCF
jgi:hypothetical protein